MKTKKKIDAATSVHKVGDIVRSKVTAQGMTKGALYRVDQVRTWSTLTGRYTNYDLRLVGGTEAPRDVGNGHLVLEA